MVVCKIKATLPGDLQRVWDLVTNVKDYSWRSDLSRTEILNQRQFIEYTLDGFPTTFTVDVWEPYSRWEFHMESTRITGRWTGTFQEAGSATQVEFTEAVRPLCQALFKTATSPLSGGSNQGIGGINKGPFSRD